jgi:transposase-like protein
MTGSRYPQEFRDDVVRVAQARAAGVSIAQIAKDFGVGKTALARWLQQAEVDQGKREGFRSSERAEFAELKRRNRLLEQENEVLRRTAAYLSQANLPGK